jgi:3-methyl-2-oxobutanoate hydroxymethyltransferase
VVLEGLPGDLAGELTESLSIPTIGIGAGPHCDGQVLVLYDLLGLDERFNPRFLKKYLNLSETVVEALGQFGAEVRQGTFPGPEHFLHSARKTEE